MTTQTKCLRMQEGFRSAPQILQRPDLESEQWAYLHLLGVILGRNTEDLSAELLAAFTPRDRKPVAA